MSRPSRRYTSTVFTDGHWATASSATSFIFTTWPRREKPSAVISTFASQSDSREATAPAPKPEKQGV